MKSKAGCICCGLILSLVQFLFSFFCVWLCITMSIKQRKIKIEPRIKLNHNIYTGTILSTLSTASGKQQHFLICRILNSLKELWGGFSELIQGCTQEKNLRKGEGEGGLLEWLFPSLAVVGT